MDEIPNVCSPLLVVENAVGKKRLVLNLRYLSQHCGSKIQIQKFVNSDDVFNPEEYLFVEVRLPSWIYQKNTISSKLYRS